MLNKNFAILMKTPFRRILITSLAALTTVFSVAYTSCNRDKCKTIVCANNGVCDGGKCTCPSGYQGSNCETVSRDKFIGNWRVFEKGSITAAAQYPISIEKAGNITDVVIRNFNNYFLTPVRGYVSGDTLTIPNQQMEGKLIFGTGIIYSTNTYTQFGAISMAYEVIDSISNIPDDYGFYGPDGSQPSSWNK
jgi:hypothetical protein